LTNQEERFRKSKKSESTERVVDLSELDVDTRAEQGPPDKTNLDEEDPDAEKEEEHIFPVFSRPLAEVAGNAQVPYIVRVCVTALCQTHFLEEEGILRQSGSKTLIEALKKKFDDGKRPNLKKQDPHAVSGLLKMYLRELPESLIPSAVNQKVAEIIAQQTNPELVQNISEQILHESIRKEISEQLMLLPRPNYETFKYLIGFFALVSSYSTVNLMNLTNIITCFAPTLKCVPGLMKICTEDYDFFFSS
jgi:hypothetical protein